VGDRVTIEGGATPDLAEHLRDLAKSRSVVVRTGNTITESPADAGEWRNLGIALSFLGDQGRASRAIEKALQLDPRDQVAWRARAVLLERVGDYEAALDAIEIALDLEPLDATAAVGRAYLLNMLGRPVEALDAAEAGVALDASDPRVWFEKAFALDELGRYHEAADALHRAIVLNPDDAEAWRNLGAALGRVGRDDDALQAFTRACEIDPSDAASWRGIGFFLMQRDNRLEEAADALARAVRLNPSDLAAWRDLASVQRSLALRNEGLSSETDLVESLEEALKAIVAAQDPVRTLPTKIRQTLDEAESDVAGQPIGGLVLEPPVDLSTTEGRTVSSGEREGVRVSGKQDERLDARARVEAARARLRALLRGSPPVDRSESSTFALSDQAALRDGRRRVAAARRRLRAL
jgi:tetratricopeptide (TPR) repeat protein